MANITATGYVHKMLDDEQNFHQFVWSCARAFGALIHMRDDSMDTVIVYPEVDDYHERSLQMDREKLEGLLAMTEDEREVYGVRLRTDKIVRMECFVRKQQEDISLCRAMLTRVERWEPPTSEHQGLKEFMREQLLTSIGDEEYSPCLLDELRAKDPGDYFDEAVRSARQGIDYHVEGIKTEQERVSKKVEWLDSLQRSITD